MHIAGAGKCRKDANVLFILLLWYLMQGGLMVLAGIVALVFPMFSSLAVVVLLQSHILAGHPALFELGMGSC